MTRNPTTKTPARREIRPRHRTAALTLVFLAPFLAEVSSGATRVSYLFAFVPEMMVWGCGALLIRELVRRWRGGWTSILLLGLALSVAEEFLIQQTSLAPLPWPAISAGYGRLWGVNWIYLLFMLGFESVWTVLVPVQLTELIFPGRPGGESSGEFRSELSGEFKSESSREFRNELRTEYKSETSSEPNGDSRVELNGNPKDQRTQPWLGPVGLAVSGLVFLLGAYIAWFAWIKRARPVVFHAPEYHPAPAALLAGALAIALLILAAYLLRHLGHPPAARSTPPAWAVFLATLALGFPWYWLMGLIFGVKSPLPFWLPILIALAWATLAYTLIRRWSGSPAWRDMHRWALTFGATVVCMAAGFAGSSTWPQIDVIGKLIFNALAVLGFLLLARRIQRRTPSVNRPSPPAPVVDAG